MYCLGYYSFFPPEKNLPALLFRTLHPFELGVVEAVADDFDDGGSGVQISKASLIKVVPVFPPGDDSEPELVAQDRTCLISALQKKVREKLRSGWRKGSPRRSEQRPIFE